MGKIEISEAAIIDGVYHHDRNMGYKLYERCREYYQDNFQGIFFVDEDSEKDIFQNTMITLLEKIDNKSIYADNGVLYGKSGEKFTSSLTTYFMGIVKLKNLELAPNCNGTGTISQTILGLGGFINNINGPIQISRIRHKIFTMSTLL